MNFNKNPNRTTTVGERKRYIEMSRKFNFKIYNNYDNNRLKL